MADTAVRAISAAIHTPSTVFVPGGHFLMGSDGDRLDEQPVHPVEVRPLRVGRTPVTNMEYAWFLADGGAPGPPWWKDPAFWDPLQPVVGTTWFEAAAYCAGLGGTFGGRWRLPTEAEWERAVRGGLEQQPTPWGAEAPAHELVRRPSSGPSPTGCGTANAFGLCDPGTLVHEWCQDWHAVDAYRFTRRYDPRGPEGGRRRVWRGGSWRRQASLSQRGALDPLARSADCGFRVVREVP